MAKDKSEKKEKREKKTQEVEESVAGDVEMGDAEAAKVLSSPAICFDA